MIIKPFNKNIQQGFTLIELLVVIGILAVLLAITLIAINPAKQFQSANDTKRRSDVNAILNAVNQYQADNQGSLPATANPIAGSATIIGKGVGQIDICSFLVTKYLAALPVDPLTNSGSPVTNCGAAYNANYTILKSATDSRITVSAPAAEGGSPISVTR